MKDDQLFDSTAKIHVTRLKPGDDLRQRLCEVAVARQIKAAVVVTCVGSLVQYNLRFANQREGSMRQGYFEIVSLTGTLCDTSAHFHLAVSDRNGTTTGGHLLDGNLVYTTAEIAIAELTRLSFEQVPDEATGYKELHIRKSGNR